MQRLLYSIGTLSICLLICLTLSCGGDETGNCSISCGGSGTGQPFVQTNHPFTTEDDCRNMGEERGGGCRAAFCPPTGDPDDCYQVWP